MLTFFRKHFNNLKEVGNEVNLTSKLPDAKPQSLNGLMSFKPLANNNVYKNIMLLLLTTIKGIGNVEALVGLEPSTLCVCGPGCGDFSLLRTGSDCFPAAAGLVSQPPVPSPLPSPPVLWFFRLHSRASVQLSHQSIKV